MSVGEIISDALVYPFKNIKALVLYAVLTIIAAIIAGASLLSFAAAFHSTGFNGMAFSGLGLLGFILLILVIFLTEGYALDIVKYGIERRADSPAIDFGRQIANAVKLIVVDLVYYIVPAIIIFILGLFLKSWILTIISIILVIVFALANFMAKCKLAQTDNLGAALAIGDAIGNISRVGIGKLIVTIIVILIILIIASIIIGLLSRVNGILGSIVLGLFLVYLVFFYNRAIGLLYSDN